MKSIKSAATLNSPPGARDDPRLLALKVNEVYLSIQGESTWAGLRCAFVRLTACDLRCTYCDTAYAFYDGAKRTLGDLFDEVMALDSPLGRDHRRRAAAAKKRAAADADVLRRRPAVLIETSGAHDISGIDPRVHRIMDLKTPSSGECARNLFSNIPKLTPRDEVKFVIGSREDYEWSRGQIIEHNLARRCGAVLFSPVFGRIEPARIVEWMIEDKLEARFQLQMHKFIWDPKAKGV